MKKKVDVNGNLDSNAESLNKTQARYSLSNLSHNTRDNEYVVIISPEKKYVAFKSSRNEVAELEIHKDGINRIKMMIVDNIIDG